MSDAKKNIKDAFDKIQDLSGQRAKYRALQDSVDELIDRLNELIESSTHEGEKEKAGEAIKSLLAAKDEDFLNLKLAEDELKGRGTTKSKEREYTRQLDSAIDTVRTAISSFM